MEKNIRDGEVVHLKCHKGFPLKKKGVAAV
jgi:hypothetical protein